MSQTFDEIMRLDPEIVVELPPEEIALPLLHHLIDCEQRQHRQKLNRGNFFRGLQGVDGASVRAGVEAWLWLNNEALIAPNPAADTSDWVYVTRRGHKLASSNDLASYRHSRLLPKGTLHPGILQVVSGAFFRGDYDTAVFAAFKQIEVAVRAAAEQPDNSLGVPLMRAAFHVETGKLTDTSVVNSERQAMSDLFAGAMGTYKNPHSHRNVAINDPVEAVEIIMLASRLMKIVDERASMKSDCDDTP